MSEPSQSSAQGLAHGLADPLHIEEPFPVWAVILGALALWALYRLYRRLAGRQRPVTRQVIPPPPPPGGFSNVVNELRRRYAEDCRRGCHELASALRGYFQRRGHVQFETLTATEIQGKLGDRPATRLFALLAQLQFYRRGPTLSDFHGACDLALDVVSQVEKGR